MLFWIEHIIATLITIFCIVELFHILGPSRENMKFIGKAATLILLGTGLFCVALCPQHLFYIRWLISLLLITLTMCIYKGFRLIRTLYVSIFAFALIELMECSKQFMEGMLNGYKPDIPVWSLLSMLVTKGILVGIVFGLKRIFDKKLALFSLNASWLAFTMIPLGTFLIPVLWMLGGKNAALHPVGFVFGVIAVFMINIASFYLLVDLIQRQMYILNQQTGMEETEDRLKAYETITECLNEQRRRTHEYKNYIHCIYYLLEMGKQEELRKYVNDLRYGMHLKNAVVCETKHILIDAIVNAKHKEAVAKGIEFSVYAEELYHCIMEDEDVITVISNLLNNAVEAAENCPESSYISVRMEEDENKWKISVKNSHRNQIQTAEGEILTGKQEDSVNHGFGLMNIKATVHKYKGQCKISYTETEFVVDIEIPLV